MNILVLTTYPIENPRHGGQIRVSNIVNAYRNAGISVEVRGVLGSANYEKTFGFVACPLLSSIIRYVKNPFLMEDYAIGELFANDQRSFNSLLSEVSTTPDVIQVEHPWLFAFAQKYASMYAKSAKLIYSSHNVEFSLKHDILSFYFDQASASESAQLIKSLELNAITNADLIFCVSEDDARFVRSYTSTPVAVFPNGVAPWEVMEGGLREAIDITQDFKYALYCASAHPPNMAGFFKLFGGGFGSLKPDEKLVIAGGAGNAIVDDNRIHLSAKLAERVLAAGMVSQQCLGALLDRASCIVLPLTHGGGTNLKTAEALWSGKYVIATSVAMRGFEMFMNSPGVYVTDDPSEFKRAIRNAMSLDPLSLTSEEWGFRRSVLWDQCLRSLPSLVLNLT